MTKSNINFPLQNFEDIEDEIWNSVIFHGLAMDNYTVSNYGNIIGPRGHKMKWSNSHGYPAVGITHDINFAGHTYYIREAQHKKTTTIVNVHTLVASAFIPLNENPPEVFDQYITINGNPYHLWDLQPTECKLFIRSLLQVDHIDDNKANPHVSNLQYISPRGNNKAVKKNSK